MPFKISDKVAIITGGATGIGLSFAKELLQRNIKGVVIADINETEGLKSEKELQKFGKNKAIFIRADVSSKTEFEEVFKKTVEKFKNIDILFNNAGILNDAQWEKTVNTNVKGTINGMLLAMEHYLPKYKSGDDAVIINIASTASVEAFPSLPIYVSTKFAIHGMTLAWGSPQHYQRTKVRVVGLAPGATSSRIIDNIEEKTLGDAYNSIIYEDLARGPSRQSSEKLAQSMIPVLEKAPTGTMWLVEGGEPAFQYVMPDRFNLTEKIYLN